MEAKMQSVSSPLPDNINKATLLEITEPSRAGDVFHILMNYPKLKVVRVGGTDYKREQIGKLTANDSLGGGIGRSGPVFTDHIIFTEPATGGAGRPEPALVVNQFPDPDEVAEIARGLRRAATMPAGRAQERTAREVIDRANAMEAVAGVPPVGRLVRAEGQTVRANTMEWVVEDFEQAPPPMPATTESPF